MLIYLINFQEVAEPLQDLKDGIEELKRNKTLRYVLATLRSMGNLLNNTNVRRIFLTICFFCSSYES